MKISSLYKAGSLFFLIASMLIHPKFSENPIIYLASVLSFISGSLIFFTAGILGVKSVNSFKLSPPVLSTIGASCFVIGSICFLPLFDGAFAKLGTYIFRGGSLSYIASSLWGLSPLPQQKIKIVSSLIAVVGACLFIIGGVLFLEGMSHPGSLFWVAGSSLFFLSSTV